MDEDRLIDIETKVAHQEHLLAELNDALTSQRAQLTDLENLCRTLVERLRNMSDGGEAVGQHDEKPPHY